MCVNVTFLLRKCHPNVTRRRCVMVFWGESLGERLVKLDQVQLDFLNKPKGKTKIMEIPDIRCGSVRPQLWAVVFRSHQIDKGATGHWRKRSSWLACVVSPSYCKDVSHWKFLSLFGGKGYDIYIYIYIYLCMDTYLYTWSSNVSCFHSKLTTISWFGEKQPLKITSLGYWRNHQPSQMFYSSCPTYVSVVRRNTKIRFSLGSSSLQQSEAAKIPENGVFKTPSELLFCMRCFLSIFLKSF